MNEIKVGTIVVPQEEFTKWIQALRSGEYKQTTGQLNNNEGFCCLGVACKVLIPQDKLEPVRPGSGYTPGFIEGRVPAYHPNAPAWLRFINLDSGSWLGFNLAYLNDCEHLTFDEIADLLEAVYIEKVLS
jgi:hypothetical protein